MGALSRNGNCAENSVRYNRHAVPFERVFRCSNAVTVPNWVIFGTVPLGVKRVPWRRERIGYVRGYPPRPSSGTSTRMDGGRGHAPRWVRFALLWGCLVARVAGRLRGRWVRSSCFGPGVGAVVSRVTIATSSAWWSVGSLVTFPGRVGFVRAILAGAEPSACRCCVSRRRCAAIGRRWVRFFFAPVCPSLHGRRRRGPRLGDGPSATSSRWGRRWRDVPWLRSGLELDQAVGRECLQCVGPGNRYQGASQKSVRS